jgi:hypothetical protein
MAAQDSLQIRRRRCGESLILNQLLPRPVKNLHDRLSVQRELPGLDSQNVARGAERVFGVHVQAVVNGQVQAGAGDDPGRSLDWLSAGVSNTHRRVR